MVTDVAILRSRPWRTYVVLVLKSSQALGVCVCVCGCKEFRSKFRGWRLNHFPGQPVPMLDNPLGEEKFPNIQSKPPLAQLEAISSCPITCYLGEETNPHLSTTSFQAKQSQLPQPLLIRLLLQTRHQLHCPSLHTLQHLNVPLVVGGPKLNTVFEVRPHQCQVQGDNHFPSPAGHTIFDTSQDAIGFLGRLGTLLAHIQAAVKKHPQVLLCQAAFQPLFPKPVALHGVAVAQVQDLALGLVKPHTIDLDPSSQPVQVPLQSLPTLQQINTPAQLGVVCKLTESTLDPFIQIIDKNVKQNWPQHRALGNTACDRRFIKEQRKLLMTAHAQGKRHVVYLAENSWEEFKPVPMLDNPFGEDVFPNIQSKPPLVQLDAIYSHPIICYSGEDTNTHLATTSFQVAVESNKVSPQPPLLQAKQPQFPQLLLIRLVLQTLHQLRCPSLDTLQQLNVPLVVRGPTLNTVFEVRPHQCRVQGHNHFPTPVSHGEYGYGERADATGNLGLTHTKCADPRDRDQSTELGKPQTLNHVTAIEQQKKIDGESVPMLDNPLGEEKFPNIQSKPPLAQLEAISSCPITCYLGEETDPHLSTASFQVVVESNEVSPQPPFLQAKQSQLPQPLLISLVLQTLHQLRCPSLYALQYLNIPLVVGGPKLNTVFEVWPHQCRVQGHNHFPSPAGHAIFDTSQDAIGLLGRLGTLLAHIQAAVNQHPQVLLCQAAFQPLFPKPVALHGVAVAQVQDLALGLTGDNPDTAISKSRVETEGKLSFEGAKSSCAEQKEIRVKEISDIRIFLQQFGNKMDELMDENGDHGFFLQSNGVCGTGKASAVQGRDRRRCVRKPKAEEMDEPLEKTK
ncbi:hypothetical protein QYF61_013704, partial [Mycteria americana]